MGAHLSPEVARSKRHDRARTEGHELFKRHDTVQRAVCLPDELQYERVGHAVEQRGEVPVELFQLRRGFVDVR